MSRSKRVAILAASALACSALSGLIALALAQDKLRATDAAHGLSLEQILVDPFVMSVWSGIVVACAVVGFLCALVTLWRTDLRWTLPIVGAVAVGTSATFAADFLPMSPFMGLAAGIATMGVIRDLVILPPRGKVDSSVR